MSKRTYAIAEAIMDSAISEYRFINLKSIESVDDYAFCAMNKVISSDEAEVILKSCRAYMSFLSSFNLPDFHGSDDWAIKEWELLVKKPLQKYNGRNKKQTLDRIKAAFCVLTKSPAKNSLAWIGF